LWLITEKNPFKNKSFYSLTQRIEKAKKIVKQEKKIKVISLDKIVGSSRSINIINYLINEKKTHKYLLYYRC
jgi:phosphopantetheine adenylyltransferase